jgi:hypothetical protein
MADIPFLIVVAVSLALMSVLIAFRMNSVGATTAQIVTVIAEVWAVFAIWIAVLSVTVGWQGGGAFVARFGAMSAGGKAAVVVALLVSIGLFLHLQRTLRQAMRRGGNREGGA